MTKYRRFYINQTQATLIRFALKKLIDELEEKEVKQKDNTMILWKIQAEQLEKDLKNYEWLRKE